MPKTSLLKALYNRTHYSGRRGRKFESSHPDHLAHLNSLSGGFGISIKVRGRMNNFFKLAAVALASTLLPSCGSPAVGRSAPSPAEAPRTDNGQATLSQIRALIGTPSCTASSQCQSLPVGATPCGSPEGYLPWSSAQTPAKALSELAQRYRQQRMAFHAASGALSDCRMAPDPGAVCQRLPGAAPAAAGICAPAGAN